MTTKKKGMLKEKKKIEGKILNVQSAEEQEGKSEKGERGWNSLEQLWES